MKFSSRKIVEPRIRDKNSGRVVFATMAQICACSLNSKKIRKFAKFILKI
jgi:hypothetical protein